jgi:predicted anti-sigma-YlaC factor YlaD
MAVKGMADALSGGGTSVYLSDDDPVLVGQALPFSLKLMETVLQETPEHQGLLVATAAAFVMYAHGYVLRPARVLESTDLVGARREMARAKALFLRGEGYAKRALEASRSGFLGRLEKDPAVAVAELTEADVPAMYWYAAALASAVSTDKSDMGLVDAFPVVPALLGRGLELDEAWSQGAIHALLVSVTAGGGDTGTARAEHHFRRAMELNEGRSVGPLVTMAETVCIREQDRKRFTDLLSQALVFDVDRHPETRLSNILAQKHAAWLLDQVDELFFAAPEQPSGEDGPKGGMRR